MARTASARTYEPPSLHQLLRLSDDTAMPLYRQLELQLSAMILDGRLPVGSTLPAERKLANDLNVSRSTVQNCYDALRRKRLLSAHGRLGFIVEEPGAVVKPGMDRLKGFTEEMRELGRTPSSMIVEQIVTTERSIASVFGRPSTAPLLKLVRIRFGDGIPMSREVAWYDITAAPGLEEADLSGSVYAALGDRGAALATCEQTIEAATPNADECEIFGFDAPLPCLLIKRRSYDRRDRMVEYVEGLFRGDAYAYRLKLTV